VDPARGPYCLTAPLAGSSALPVSAEPCTPTAVQPLSRQWRVRGLAGTWADSFRVEAAAGGCLAGSTLAVDAYADKAVVAPCDSTRIQKWTVPPGAFRPRLGHIGEG
jgi:hypothetical protein